MTDVASLKIRVDSLEARLAGKDLDALARKGDGAARATDGLARAMARFAGPAAIAAGAVAGFNKIVSSQRQFDILNAGLITATGSTEGAAQAFKALQQFATETPYSLQQVSEAFVKLQNYGLDPSERALTSYGNTSAALGKDLMQMVEAIADATTGEFERLKEFGIKSRKEGDQIKFTFRGVTESVQNDAAAIEEYLIRLGEVNFAGNMETRMKTLDGAMSNLGDEWDKMWLGLSQGGLGEEVADGVRVVIDVLAELNDYLASGQFEAHMEAIGASFGPWVDDATEAFEIVRGTVSDFGNWLAATFPEDMQILTDAWQDFPENIRAIIQIAVDHVAWFVESVRIAAVEVGDYWRAVKDGWGGATLKDAYAASNAAMSRNNDVLARSIELTLQARDATDAAADAKAREGKMRRASNSIDNLLSDNSGDQLAGFRRPRPAATGSTGEDQRARASAEKAAERAREQRQREFQALSDSLRTEEERIRDSYDKRKAIILANTAESSEARAKLMGRLDDELREQEKDLADSQARRIEAAREGLETEERELENHFARRRQLVIENIKNPEEQAALLAKLQLQKDTERAFLAVKEAEDRDRLLQTRETELELLRAQIEAEIRELEQGYEQKLISEEEYLRRREELVARQNQSAMDVERRMWKDRLAVGEEMFSGLAELAKSYGGEQSKAFKAMFAVQKAFTIASAALDIQKTISDAMAKGWPQNIPLIAQAIGQGARILSTIRGLNYSGAYDSGGWIPAGSIGTVAERGDEIVNGQLVRGPAKVVSRKDTQAMLAGGGGDTYVSITVNMQGGETATDVSASGANAESAKQLGGLIELKVRDVLIREKRPGGLLYTPKVA